ncbi:uncharacterized protein VTP21DRAFT_2522 [Calcarisporiella thermophila]|uniref:uncharacterized protein n=1 Tax=Calcarisporiella thermophila TaxID=911321 RepID=UPI00374442E7
MRSSLFGLLYLVAYCLNVFVLGKSTTGDRVLIVLDDLESRNNYSNLWRSLQERSFKLQFKAADDASLEVTVPQERIFDHAIIFAPKSKTLWNKAGAVKLVDFVKLGGNLLIGADPSLTEQLRDFAREFEIEFDERDTWAIDHAGYDPRLDEGKHQTLVSNHFGPNAHTILGADVISGPPVLYKGIAHGLGQGTLLSPILVAGRTAYSAEVKDEPVEDDVWLTGNGVKLVSAMQARNSARITFAGSLDLFSDRFWKSKASHYAADSALFDKQYNMNISESVVEHEQSGNAEFVKELTRWTFQEKGVLKISQVHHHKTEETEQLSMYRMKDNITYTIDISEYVNDAWVPFNVTDVQLEVRMLDPYIRTTLRPLSPVTNEKGDKALRYSMQLQLPDVYGVFTFLVNYKRPALTYLEHRDVVTIRHFRHSEYPRFLSMAYPYYASAASMGVGFLVFSAVWLGSWGREGWKVKKAK